MWKFRKKLVIAIFMLITALAFGESKELLSRNEMWKFSDIGMVSETWKQNEFNDSGWKVGKGPLGYGDDFSETDPSIPIGTTIGFGKDDDKFITSYFRKEIDVKNLNDIKELEMFIHVDDGAVVYINGVEAFRKGMNDEIVTYKSVGKFKAKEETFVIHNGDLVDVGMTEIQWDWLLGHSQESLLKTTIAPIAGNHEEEKDAFIEHFNIKEVPGSDTKTGAYYSYDYENTHFVMLNTNEDSKEYNNFSKEQIEWMSKDIKEAKQRGMKWIIVTIHKGPYTTSNHATDIDIMGDNGIRTKIAPMFSELGVDLVLQGHDHGYARTKPINNGKVVQTAKVKEKFNGNNVEYAVNPKGTIYMIPATGGPKVYYKNKKIDPAYYDLFDKADEHNAAKYGNDPKDKSRPVRGIIQNFAEISIDNNKLSVLVYEVDQNTDKKPYIIDSFGIIKK